MGPITPILMVTRVSSARAAGATSNSSSDTARSQTLPARPRIREPPAIVTGVIIVGEGVKWEGAVRRIQPAKPRPEGSKTSEAESDERILARAHLDKLVQ